jgi:voltage-dependent anion channel protein 2|mmetsp:Transcript_26086/g.47312  ORF Transcript_26086/g.47312 Transcript_26086/m.47312 type:complete len:267 (-) Transcript_26086:107-907(-)|eukprot:CAMPEP_0198289114 /NCGR_PEP_ID=MMETSP1449-20131203/7418_1 /TAXON_ID=420275 /ORGANISM="Attheya septentrionalis, Strain CCMP2084" /LENGTH=266 /DNA_ID=CAMNT_0043987397 /DNA_START=60 /DNA_END=860 /DNA_ORIENTATION=-
MATKFADIAKPSKTILFDDYASKNTLKCKKSAGPVAITIETEQGKEGGLTSKVGSKFAYAGLCVDKAQMTASGGQVLETSFALMDGVKLSFKGNKGADLGVDYKAGGLYATGVLDVKELSKLSTSACMGLSSGVKLGGDLAYSLASGKSGVTGFNAGASYSTGPIFAALTTSNKMSAMNIGLVYTVSPELTLASSTTHSSEKMCTVAGIGGLYKAPFGTIKAKMTGDAILSASLIKDLVPKVTVTASGSASVKDLSTFKYGIGISM